MTRLAAPTATLGRDGHRGRGAPHGRLPRRLRHGLALARQHGRLPAGPRARRRYGTLSVAGAYSQGPGGGLLIDIAGTAAGSFDRLAVSGAASSNGQLVITRARSYAPTAGDSFAGRHRGLAGGTFAKWRSPRRGATLPAPYDWELPLRGERSDPRGRGLSGGTWPRAAAQAARRTVRQRRGRPKGRPRRLYAQRRPFAILAAVIRGPAGRSEAPARHRRYGREPAPAKSFASLLRLCRAVRALTDTRRGRGAWPSTSS